MADRPTNRPVDVILDSFDGIWSGFTGRLEGLADDEYHWAPVDGWGVVADADGARVTGAGHQDPGPFTTIAWRTWHIAVDCLDAYSARCFGSTGASVSGEAWHLRADDALADLERSWQNWRGHLGDVDDAAWWERLGDEWGPFADHNLHDLTQHALHEVSHHAAEIGVLRDLWRGGVR